MNQYKQAITDYIRKCVRKERLEAEAHDLLMSTLANDQFNKYTAQKVGDMRAEAAVLQDEIYDESRDLAEVMDEEGILSLAIDVDGTMYVIERSAFGATVKAIDVAI